MRLFFSLSKKMLFTCLFFFLTVFINFPILAAEVEYGTGVWDAAAFGNHRAVVRVTGKADAVLAHIPWRRRDYHPQKKNIIISDAKSGQIIKNFFRAEINREYGDLIFQPLTVPGDYYIYYMPYITTGRKNYPKVVYPEPAASASVAWLKRHDLTEKKWPQKKWVKAKLLRIEAVNDFNSFYPMEVIAAASEVEALLAKHKHASFLLFPEDRCYPIRMTKDLPQRWVKKGVRSAFIGEAARGEFYTFQVGVYAFKENIADIRVQVSDLQGSDNKSKISAAALRCFNTGGIDWTGKKFDRTCPVKKGEVQALWFGVTVPDNLVPGEYRGELTVIPEGMEKQVIDLALKITPEVLADAGDSQPVRHSRLRWLDSTIALDDGIVPPFTPLRVNEKGDRISCLGRSVTLGKQGFPKSIRSFFAVEMTHINSGGSGREILSSPIRLIAESPGEKPLTWQGQRVRIVKKTPGVVAWKSSAATLSGALTMRLYAQMEFDGCIEYEVKIKAVETCELKDIRLEIPAARETGRYMMGMGFKGGKCPARFAWQWNRKNNQDSVWIGDVNAGLQCSFKDEKYIRPLNTNFYLSKPLVMPVSWYNGGKGGCRIEETGKNTLLLCAFSGSRTIKKGEELYFNFRLLITPFKTLATRVHWKNRYYHRFNPIDEIAAAGANTINVHHATDINPYINYPFLRPREMKAYIDRAHEKGMKVKIYYTVRELSNIAPEIFALRSLGDEILSYGPGGGFSWLQEHLGENYIAGWLVPRLNDAAVINSGTSRWHNYYLEGLNWLVRHVGIDGIYIDDVAFDRVVMKRVRKILDRGRKGALIDLHSANQYNVRDGYASSANLYLEHFPYLNRLWFGEYFDYNAQPDYWLVEISGIPFGLMGEMLQDGGNPYRGMVYGMTARLPWAGDPTPIWQVWDDFGIADSRMVGYWVPANPVKTGHPGLLATVYIKKDKTLLTLASWAEEEVKCKLAIDWDYLGINPEEVQIVAPPVKNFQEQAVFKPGDSIPVRPGKGWLLIIKGT